MPEHIDKSMREKAKQARQCLNKAVIEALSEALGYIGNPRRYYDLDQLVGTWQEDPAFDSALAAQDQVDLNLWKRSQL